MSSNHFRKLIRIAAVIVACAMLFNFFAYYLGYLGSRENERLVEVINICGRQRMLSQRITKEALFLINENNTEADKIEAKQQLAAAVTLIEKQNKFLLRQIILPGTPEPPNNAAINHLLSLEAPYLQQLVLLGQEIGTADSLLIKNNHAYYIQALRYNEKEVLPLMEEVVTQYANIMTSRARNADTINMSKFVSLIVALLCLALLVIEPLLRGSKNNLKQLHLAKVELLQEKTFLSSILNSQTNYVIRLDRKGDFTFANPEFLKTFGYVFEDLIHTPYYKSIFPKDIQRCLKTADDCWQNPGKIFRILIRKPINNSKHYLWTEWEFIALSNEDNSITELQGIGLDVSDRIQAQQRKKLYKHFLTPWAMRIWDHGNTILIPVNFC